MIAPSRTHTFDEPAPKKEPRQYNESETQKRVVHWLRQRPEWMVLRLENAAKRSMGAAARDKAMGMCTGAPDLILLYRNRLVWLELKSDKGKLSAEQRQCHAELRARAQTVIVGYGYDQTIAAMGALEHEWCR